MNIKDYAVVQNEITEFLTKMADKCSTELANSLEEDFVIDLLKIKHLISNFGDDLSDKERFEILLDYHLALLAILNIYFEIDATGFTMKP